MSRSSDFDFLLEYWVRLSSQALEGLFRFVLFFCVCLPPWL